jgi:hypothetical protein
MSLGAGKDAHHCALATKSISRQSSRHMLRKAKNASIFNSAEVNMYELERQNGFAKTCKKFNRIAAKSLDSVAPRCHSVHRNAY